jgi:hypothetical protein
MQQLSEGGPDQRSGQLSSLAFGARQVPSGAGLRGSSLVRSVDSPLMGVIEVEAWDSQTSKA